jgi:hypothetical protein
MASSGTHGTKQNKVEDCRKWPMHHQGATGVSKEMKLSAVIYDLCYQMPHVYELKITWLKFAQNILNGCGMPNIWSIQAFINSKWI